MEIIIAERYGDDNWQRLVAEMHDDSGNMLSRGAFTFTPSGFGGNTVKTMMAGGVATSVENRRGGNVRKIFDYMHALAVEEGVATAILHPFSFSYYKKFGYGRVADHLIARFPTEKIDFVPRQCKFVPYDANKLKDMLTVYRRFSQGRNLLLHRFDDRWYTKDKRTAYICYDGNEPIAYIVYQTQKTLDINHYKDTVLSVCEMAYTSPAGLREIFSFLRMFEGEFDTVELPDCTLYPEADMLLQHYTHTAYRLLPDLAARVLNTGTMLEANEYPLKEGQFTIKVVDILPSVSGVYQVNYGGGDCRVIKLDDNTACDMTLTADAFASLLYGYRSLNSQTVLYADGIEVHRNCEDVLRAFPKRPAGAFEQF